MAFDGTSLRFEDAKGQSAVIRIEESGGHPSAVITTRDAKGQSREKRITYTGSAPDAGFARSNVFDKALRDVLKRGFWVRPPQEGPIDVLVATEVGPPMGYAFAVDEARGIAWVGDWGALRAITLATGDARTIPLGDWRAVREVAIAPDGTPRVFAELDPEAKDSRWRAPSPGMMTAGVLALRGSEIEPIVAMSAKPVGQEDVPALSMAYADDGSFAAPHAQGLGVYSAEGALEHVVPARTAGHGLAKGTLDPSGTWAVATRGQGALNVWNRRTRQASTVEAPFALVHRLRVGPEGTIDIHAEDWDVIRCEPGKPPRKLGIRSVDIAISSEGARLAQLAGEGSVIETSTRSRIGSFPIVGIVKNARLALTGAHVYARTDLGVLQRIAISGSS